MITSPFVLPNRFHDNVTPGEPEMLMASHVLQRPITVYHMQVRPCLAQCPCPTHIAVSQPPITVHHYHVRYRASGPLVGRHALAAVPVIAQPTS